MNYIIMDLEWNQPFPKDVCLTTMSGAKFHGEIVEIGAVKLNAHFEVVDFFRRFIKPKYYKKLHPMVKKITAISPKDLAEGIPFPEGVEMFRRWCGRDAVLMTWGKDDVPILCDNLDFFDLDKSWVVNWYDLQAIFGLQAGVGTEQKSLQFAMEYFEIPCEKRLHDAFNDAFYTSQVCRFLDFSKGAGNAVPLPRSQKRTRDGQHPESVKNVSFVYAEQRTYPSKKAAFSDRHFATVHCEDGGVYKVPPGSWMRQSNEKYVALAHGDCCDAFLVRMKFRRTGGAVKVHKVVWKATEEMVRLYRDLADKSRRKRKSLRSAG